MPFRELIIALIFILWLTAIFATCLLIKGEEILPIAAIYSDGYQL